MSAFQQRTQLLRRHIQDPGLLAAGYRIKKRKLPVLKLQNSFFDGVLCNQLIDLHVCLLADTVGAQPVMTGFDWGRMKVQLPSNYATILRLKK